MLFLLHFGEILFNDGLQLRYVNGNGFPQLFRSYFIVSMHQNMTHTLNIVPIHFRVIGTVFKSQFIDSLANYFNMFYQAEIYNWIS